MALSNVLLGQLVLVMGLGCAMTKLAPNIVVTIELAMEYASGRMQVHEEDIVMSDGEPELLTRRAPREMPRIG